MSSRIEAPRGRRQGLGVFVATWYDGTSKGQLCVAAAGLVGDGSDVEAVGATPSATGGDPETSGDTSTVGAPDTGASSPESVGGAAFDSVGGSAGEADGAAEAVGETPDGACAIPHPGGVANHTLPCGGREREYGPSCPTPTTARLISVRGSYDRNTGRVKQTKTGNKGMRLRRRGRAAPATPRDARRRERAGPVVDMRQQKWWAADLRKHLEAAGIKREALYSTDDTRKRLRFHDLRGTGLTWMAIRGDDPLKIQQRGGHRTFEMTQKYIRTAEAVGQLIGAVFPPLPESLAAGRYRREYRPSDAQLTETTARRRAAPQARK